MDKLQPILKHQFWILLVPLLSLTIWGYVSTNGKLRAATMTREDELKKALSSIPKGATDPNQKYIDGLQKHNEFLEKFVKEELDELWVRQLPRMVWPEIVQPGIPEIYKDPITDIQTRENYRTEYDKIIENLHQSVEPFIANKSLVTWTEKVDFPISLIPRARRWHLTPPDKEIWEAQEDVWLTQLILDAIRDMNKDADSAQSAVVRKVIKYQLLGGDGESTVGAAASSDGSGSSADMMSSPEMPIGGGGGGFGGGSGMSKAPAIQFNPQEEFGAGGTATAGGFGGGMPMPMESSGSGSVDPSGTGAEPVEILRYVKEDTAAPFVERGFYLSVIIHQTKMVEFLARLQNSEWPIRITRFHFGKNPYASAMFGGSGAGGAGGLSPSSGFSPSMMESPSLVPESSDFSSPDSGLFGGGSSSGFGGPGAAGGNTGYPKTAIESADLIQLDLCGLITMYRQPAAAAANPAATTPADGTEPAPDAPATDGTAPPAGPDGSAPTTETPAAPMEGAPTDGTPPEAAPATPEGPPTPVEGTEATPPAEPGTPVTEPAAPAPEGVPAPTEAATEAPTTPAEPAAP